MTAQNPPVFSLKFKRFGMPHEAANFRTEYSEPDGTRIRPYWTNTNLDLSDRDIRYLLKDKSLAEAVIDVVHRMEFANAKD